MKVWTVKEPGGRDQLLQEEREMPKVEAGELLIKVKAFGINRVEIINRENKNQTPPYPILGVEVAGEVIENHSSNEALKPGTRVIGLVNKGSYAEYTVMPAEFAMVLPDELSYEEGAAIPEVFLTAYQTMYWLGELQDEDTILIHAGASGVGTAAIQMAKQLSNAKVIATSSNQEKLDTISELGGDVPVNYREETIEDRVLEVTDGRGADVILDFIGASYWDTNLKSAAVDARWVLIGLLGGAEVEKVNLGAMLGKRLQLKATLLTPRSNDYKGKLSQEFAEKVLPLFAEGKVKPVVHTVIDFNELPSAHEMMENNENIGKIIISIND